MFQSTNSIRLLPSLSAYKKIINIIILSLSVSIITGCAGVTVKRVSTTDQIAKRRSDVLTTGKLSAVSQETLKVIGYDVSSCKKNYDLCLETIKNSSGLNEEQRLSTLSEIWLQIAMEKNKNRTFSLKNKNVSGDEWVEAARHAYAYLFFTERKPGERAFEDRQTQVKDYYNYAIQQAMTGVYKRYQEENPTVQIQDVTRVNDWEVDVNIAHANLPDDVEFPRTLISADSLSFSGIRNTYRRDGFGADLIATAPAPKTHPRKQKGSDKKEVKTLETTEESKNEVNNIENTEKTNKEAPYKELPFFPITALLGFEGDSLEEVLNTKKLKLELFDPYSVSSVSIAKEENVPLSANFTANYGLWLAHSNFSTQAFRNLFGREGGITDVQIYLMQPYDPNRKVVAMLHGIASSPEAWINLANEVLGDEELRKNYQIWLVYYPTNVPIPINNKNIQQALTQTLNKFDPNKAAIASKDMTLIGHSMGGILSRLMISSSDNAIWESFSQAFPMDDKDKAKVYKELSPYVNFKPLPEVSSAIFIAAPHRGTDFANNKIARWISNLILIPPTMLQQLTNTSNTISESLIRVPNSVDNLSDKDVFMQMSSNLPISSNVQYFSIIGNYTPKRKLLESNDGVVPYKSAHLENACSELVVNSFHSVQEKPEAILEIRRILKAQLKGKVFCNLIEPSI